MRQTLLRILLDELFALKTGDGMLYVGVGWLVLPWAIVGLWWLGRFLRRSDRERGELVSSAVGWGLVAAGLLTVPLWAGRWAPHGIPVYGYGFMLFVGFLAAGWTAARRAERVNIPGDVIWDATMWVFFAGIVGARLFYLAEYHERVFAGKHGLDVLIAAVNLPDGGLVLYGGVVLAIATYFAFCRWKKLNPLLMADVMIPSFFIGLGFGRIGCFLNGCCYGDPSSLPWAVTFPKDSVPFIALVNRGMLNPDAAVSLALHPTQLYSSINGFVLAFVTAMYFRHRVQYRQAPGAVLGVALLVYPVTRFLIEFLRGDEPGQLHTALTISQWVSLGVCSLGVVYWIWLSRREHPSPHSNPGVSEAVGGSTSGDERLVPPTPLSFREKGRR